MGFIKLHGQQNAIIFFHFHCQTRTTACSLHLAVEEMTTATIDKQLAKKPAQNPLLCALAQHKVDI